MKNLSVNIEDELHLKVKMKALVSGMSLKEYLLKIIEKDLKEERKQADGNVN